MATPYVIGITGAARRLGRAMALHLATPGRHLALHHRNSQQEAETTAAECRERGATVSLHVADQANVGECETLVAAMIGVHGRLDAFINNASIYFPTKLLEVTEADYDSLNDVNAKGPFFLMQAAGRAMMSQRGGGVIVNLADAAYETPSPSYIPYMMGKAALICATRGFARALAPLVRVNAIAPGVVLPPEDQTEKGIAASIAKTPMNRVGTPEDIARAAEFLLFQVPYVTGIVLPVDGGRGTV